MKSFSKLLDGLQTIMKEHPEVHYRWPMSLTEMDLKEAEFILQDYISKQVVVDERIQDWLDSYRFFHQQQQRAR